MKQSALSSTYERVRAVRRSQRAWLLVAAAIIAVGGALLLTKTPATAQTTGPVIQAGSGEAGYAVNLYGSNDVTVVAGATVTWKAGWFESHSVTFSDVAAPQGASPTAAQDLSKVYTYDGSAYLTSGLWNTTSPVQTFRVTFPKPGKYNYLCAIHGGQTGSVTVVAAGAGTATTQTDIDRVSQRVFADGLASLKTLSSQVAAKPITQTTNPDGTSTWRIVSVGGKTTPADPSELMQFYPATLNIKQGDTVVWHSDVTAPHTVTFLASKPLPTGAAGTAPSSTPLPAAYDGSDLLNSGAFGVGRGSQDFTLKFTNAGSFAYICVPHVTQGMGGNIVVAAAQAVAPAPPKTGAGVESEHTNVAVRLLGALTAAVLAFGGRRASARR